MTHDLREALDSLLAFRHGDTKHLTAEHARILYEALTASPGEQKPVVEGYVLVPVEPTPEIIRAMHHKIDWCRDDQNTYEVEHPSQNPNGVGTTCKQDICDAYRAMIEALRREAPAPEGVVSVELLNIERATGDRLRSENDKLRATIASLSPSTSRPDAGGGVRVKPLEWHDNRHAQSILGVYSINSWSSGAFSILRPNKGYPDNNSFPTVDEAKAAAQADYERRILSALSTSPAAAESDASVEAKEDLADWSNLPKDIYVIAAQRVNAVGFDVQCCSVPMVTAPEVRYVRADMVAKPNASVEARLRERIEELDQMCINREEFIASKSLWKEFSAFLASPPSVEGHAETKTGEPQDRMPALIHQEAGIKPGPSDPTAERREIVARALMEKWPGDYAWGDETREPNELAFETADAILAALDGGAGA